MVSETKFTPRWVEENCDFVGLARSPHASASVAAAAETDLVTHDIHDDGYLGVITGIANSHHADFEWRLKVDAVLVEDGAITRSIAPINAPRYFQSPGVSLYPVVTSKAVFKVKNTGAGPQVAEAFLELALFKRPLEDPVPATRIVPQGLPLQGAARGRGGRY